jgi:uncharacterized membrane protein YdjX (TVP38/TMEM64 family)
VARAAKGARMSERSTWIKGTVLLLFLACTAIALQSETARSHLTPEGLHALLESVGPLAPVFFVIGFGLLASMPFPGSVLVLLGAAVFGFWYGLGLSIIGAIIGATLAFFIARKLGRDFARRIAGPTLRRYDDRLSNDGFRTVLYLRLLCIPFAPVNYASGLSGIRPRDYVAATIIGLIPSTTFLALFGAAIRDVALEHGLVSSATVHALLRWDVILAFVLLVCSFAIPYALAKRWKKELPRKKTKQKKRR